MSAHSKPSRRELERFIYLLENDRDLAWGSDHFRLMRDGYGCTTLEQVRDKALALLSDTPDETRVPCPYCGHTETPGTVMRWNTMGTDWECEGPEPCDICGGVGTMTAEEAKTARN